MPEIKEYIQIDEINPIVEDGQINIYGEVESDIDKKNIWDTSIKVEENGYYWNGEPIIKKGNNLGTEKPIVAELFCGCGGTSLGFEMAGFETVLGCDIHTPSIQTFQANHPNCSTINGDIKKVKPETIKELLNGRQLDILIGGIPCQGFSLNNRKRHENDDRNYMYKEFARFVEVLQPKVVVLENVSGMKSTGNFVNDIETHLSHIGNMTVKSKLLYAPDYGVPQKRTRLVFVGIRDNEFDFNDIIKTHGPETDKSYVTIKEAMGDLPSLKIKETKNKYKKAPFSEYQELMRINTNETFTNHTAPNHPLDTIEKIKNTKPGQPMYEKFKQRIRLAWDILSPTQVSGGIRPQFQFGHPEDNRGLSIRERCRIQSFPDDFVVKGGIVQARVQTGNAVPPLLAKAVALAIKKYL
ncbi:DNA cytosine methyltransferase [Flavobacterium bizetiae]|uniref:DNA cytosine methyltransferase n=1 Tax=Flavobacterium bizetiae TaxID=2704140 RepID=UPI0021E9487B|nr:DNA cytosine methyltransferase [Flavobacterium bizetiae]UTN06586.1 DNA cytosine methyltransferase [Flavobacterium bizetiae]